jgi:glutaredoxin
MILYSNSCPKCKILEEMLIDKGFIFQKTNNFAKLIRLGFRSAPVLEIENTDILLTYDEAIIYIKGDRI